MWKTGKTAPSWKAMITSRMPRVGKRLQQYVNRCSARKKSLGLISCCLVLGLCSVRLIIQGMSGPLPALRLEHITRMPSLTQKKRVVQYHLDPGGLQKIHRTLDSLHAHDPLRYDSLLLVHPFLLDSLNSLDTIYQHQNIQP